MGLKSACPHYGFGVGEKWHKAYGLQLLEKGWVELGIPAVGRVNLRGQAVTMVYICGKTRLPFLLPLTLGKNRIGRKDEGIAT